MEIYSANPSTIVDALHSGQRQGVAVGVIFSIGTMYLFKTTRRNVLERMNVDRKVNYKVRK